MNSPEVKAAVAVLIAMESCAMPFYLTGATGAISRLVRDYESSQQRLPDGRKSPGLAPRR
jgi:hypothetical protein